jgi:hypothetical protein
MKFKSNTYAQKKSLMQFAENKFDLRTDMLIFLLNNHTL